MTRISEIRPDLLYWKALARWLHWEPLFPAAADMNGAISRHRGIKERCGLDMRVYVHALFLKCTLSALWGFGSRFHIGSDIRKQSAGAANDPRVNLIEPDISLSSPNGAQHLSATKSASCNSPIRQRQFKLPCLLQNFQDKVQQQNICVSVKMHRTFEIKLPQRHYDYKLQGKRGYKSCFLPLWYISHFPFRMGGFLGLFSLFSKKQLLYIMVSVCDRRNALLHQCCGLFVWMLTTWSMNVGQRRNC